MSKTPLVCLLASFVLVVECAQSRHFHQGLFPFLVLPQLFIFLFLPQSAVRSTDRLTHSIRSSCDWNGTLFLIFLIFRRTTRFLGGLSFLLEVTWHTALDHFLPPLGSCWAPDPEAPAVAAQTRLRWSALVTHFAMQRKINFHHTISHDVPIRFV